MKLLLGETRRLALNQFQRALGSVTPRPLAEQVFSIYEKRGLIIEEDGVYMIDESVTPADARADARHAILSGQDARSRSKGNVRHFSVNSTNFKRARIASSWSAAMASVFAPSLFQAEGMYMPNFMSENPPEDSE